MKKFFILLYLGFLAVAEASTSEGEMRNRWVLSEDSRGIIWRPQEGGSLPHADNIEMSGKMMSAVLRYGVGKDGSFDFERSFIYPMLRTLPEDTHASLILRSGADICSLIDIKSRGKGRSLGGERVMEVSYDGVLGVRSVFGIRNAMDYETKDPVVEICRQMLVSPSKALYCERYTIKNITEKPLEINVPSFETSLSTDPKKGYYGAYVFKGRILSCPSKTLSPGESVSFDAAFFCRKAAEKDPAIDFDAELADRRAFVEKMRSNLLLSTPNREINTFFDFAKIRAAESIFDTAGGPMHSPGGESFYAAIWANDQAEYANPFFAFLGYDWADESVMNSFRLFYGYANPQYKPIPSSIISEGRGSWNSAGDRGDAAMIAYGAARYALARGDKDSARKLWPLIEWTLEYCARKLNKDGVVASDSDELENRFPAGDANLCTSSLYYDALVSAGYLSRDLGLGESKSVEFFDRADVLRKNINRYFSTNVEGFETYRYYDGNDRLRAWICIPLCAGITERSQGTIDALFSDKLWTKNGVLTISGDKTFWDRVTLYALRGAFAAGQTQRAYEHLESFTRVRLLGERVPYAVESYPERGMRQLSAESALYCRVITEGLFGIRPAGLRSFTVLPRLPASWPEMALSNIRAFGKNFDLKVSRAEGDKLLVSVKTSDGASFSKIADGNTPVEFSF